MVHCVHKKRQKNEEHFIAAIALNQP